MKVINTILPFLASLATFTGAQAGSFDAPSTVNPIPQASAVTDWNGFYAGAQAGFAQGTLDAYQNGVYSFGLPTEGTLIGVFAGYNMQRGNFVFGGEAAYNFGELDTIPSDTHTMVTKDHIDLKARAGFAFGDALVYGFAGYSFATMIESPSAVSQVISGLNYGAGVDYQFHNGMFVGLDYTIRDLSGDFDQVAFPGWTIQGPVSSINLRVGKQF